MWTSPLQGLSRIWETGLSRRRIGASVSTDWCWRAGGEKRGKKKPQPSSLAGWLYNVLWLMPEAVYWSVLRPVKLYGTDTDWEWRKDSWIFVCAGLAKVVKWFGIYPPYRMNNQDDILSSMCKPELKSEIHFLIRCPMTCERQSTTRFS